MAPKKKFKRIKLKLTLIHVDLYKFHCSTIICIEIRRNVLFFFFWATVHAHAHTYTLYIYYIYIYNIYTKTCCTPIHAIDIHIIYIWIKNVQKMIFNLLFSDKSQTIELFNTWCSQNISLNIIEWNCFCIVLSNHCNWTKNFFSKDFYEMIFLLLSVINDFIFFQ